MKNVPIEARKLDFQLYSLDVFNISNVLDVASGIIYLIKVCRILKMQLSI
jgi:hypothetical protein